MFETWPIDATDSTAAVLRCLKLLYQSHLCALDARCSLWDFATEVGLVENVGLQRHEIRWLIARGYAEHACELTREGEARRTFGPLNSAVFTERSCLVLTESGAEYCRRLFPTLESEHPFLSATSKTPLNSAPKKPTWNCDLRELRFDGVLVKQFKLPSPNQEAVLMTFEEEGWACRIDDPLPPIAQVDPKQRLHDTIRNLNRNQKTRLLRFKGDGTGEGILWEPAGPTWSDEEET